MVAQPTNEGNVMALKISAKRRAFVGVCGAFSLLASIGTYASRMPDASAVPTLPLKQIADVPLGGNTTRFDYESFDPTRHLLFVAHLGDSQVIAFDTRTTQVVGSVGTLRRCMAYLRSPN
jgi:hypothetical protein